MSDIAIELRCASDDVFIGQVESSETYPTADGSFLFTEYRVRVTEDATNRGAAVRPGAVLTVVRPGGLMVVDGRTVSVKLNDSPALITGLSYLFFGKRIAATGAYRSAHVNGTLRVTDTSVVGLTSAPAFEGDIAEGTRRDLFLNTVRAGGSCR